MIVPNIYDMFTEKRRTNSAARMWLVYFIGVTPSDVCGVCTSLLMNLI